MEAVAAHAERTLIRRKTRKAYQKEHNQRMARRRFNFRLRSWSSACIQLQLINRASSSRKLTFAKIFKNLAIVWSINIRVTRCHCRRPRRARTWPPLLWQIQWRWRCSRSSQLYQAKFIQQQISSGKRANSSRSKKKRQSRHWTNRSNSII